MPAPRSRPEPAGIHQSDSSATGRPARIYYLYATPAFALADGLLGVPLRVAGLPGLGARAGYYLVLVVLGVLVTRLPRLAPWVTMGESVGNLFLLLLSVLLPIWTFPEAFLAGADSPALLGPARLANVLLSGGMLIWAFHSQAARALGRD
jgi:hypothetical protein